MTNEMERRPKNLMAEPPYPDHPDTVMLSMSHPDWTGHLKHVECEIEEPHRIEHCGLWRNTMSEHLSTTEIAADPLERKLERVVNLLATLDMKYTFTSEEHDVCLMAIKDAHDFATEQTRELREEIERLMADRSEICGQGIQYGRFPMGCGRKIESHKEVYRCFDCRVAFHIGCLKNHCTEGKHIGHCYKCGKVCDVYPDPPAVGTCYEHCEDHDYQVIDREHRCVHCNAPAPEDYYDDEDYDYDRPHHR